jgi:hypothetical protein
VGPWTICPPPPSRSPDDITIRQKDTAGIEYRHFYEYTFINVDDNMKYIINCLKHFSIFINLKSKLEIETIYNDNAL